MGQFHWHPDEYAELMRTELPDYERLQDELAAATRDVKPAAILDLGTGTGVTARRVLDSHPDAALTGIDASADMLEAARSVLADTSATLVEQRLEDPLPAGPWHLVVSALAVHHLDGPGKADLFERLAGVLAPGGVFALADVIVPSDPALATTPLDPQIDLPSSIQDQLGWLADAGLVARVTWSEGDLAVMRATLP